MVKLTPVVLAALLMLVFPKLTSAYIGVDVSGNGDGSTSKVTVKNNVNASVDGGSSGDNRTDIRIETNGEVKEFHGTGNQDVKLESSNGNNSVSISNNIGSESNTSQSQSVEQNITVTQDPSATPTATPENTQEEEGDRDRPGLLEFLRKQFEEIRQLFSFFNRT